MAGTWWILGFTYDAVIDAWQDARLADAVSREWENAGRPPLVEVWWCTSADDYAFRWYLNEAAAELLDRANVTWRSFIVGQTTSLPDGARPFVPANDDKP
ncbi:MAG: hypothetical protein V2A73_20015 [Pseudomonadota bacterium]